MQSRSPLSCSRLGAAEADSDIIMIPAAAFSADGSAEDNYINYGDRLYTLDSTNLHFHAWVRLPNHATITNVDMMTRYDATTTITGYLKRVKFGTDNSAETLLTLTSPGNIGCSTTGGLCHDMDSLLEIPVDSANYIYWFYIFVPYAPGHTPLADFLEFYAVRIMYDYDDLIFSDTFESGDMSMWSDNTSSKSAAMPGALLRRPGLSLPPSQQTLSFWPDSAATSISTTRALRKPGNGPVGQGGLCEPVRDPRPAFKTQGYTEYDDYYFSDLLASSTADLPERMVRSCQRRSTSPTEPRSPGTSLSTLTRSGLEHRPTFVSGYGAWMQPISTQSTTWCTR